MENRNAFWWRKQLRITWHLPIVLCSLALIAVLGWKWNWLTSKPPRIVRLSGSHYEIGLQHGTLLSKEIRELYDAYILRGLVHVEGWKESHLIEIAKHYEAFIPGEYRAEMQGIARGSGTSYVKILVINTFADAMLGKVPRACSAFAVSTRDGLLVGRNLDWVNHGVAHKSGIVFVLQPASSSRVMSLSWPGLVGVVTGMNDKGLTISLNMAYAGDLETNAMPCLFRLRRTLETCQTLDAAVEDQTKQARTIAMNLLLSSASENRAVVLELSGKRHAIVEMNNGYVVTTNYYQSLPIRGGSGGDRSRILSRDLDGSGASTTIEQAEEYLSHVGLIGSPEGMVTNQSVVFVPQALTAYVAASKLPATSGRYYKIRLE